ncbi:MucBP domain-containing protein [Aerococcaceae bacterium zg-BR22]|uniref:MucBP domain-containing protein n=1 Tax=Aerococcaceae bacterium zg-1292 TaxID=2774330 RepID=UPI0040642F6C|nr:MucBP domain-containing protein [Aerococcaceae bacterium zg-BR22]
MFLKKKQRFSLRKYKIGVCSVLLGTTFVTGAHQVSAEEAGLNEAVSSTTERVEEVSEAEPVTTPETTTEEVAPEAPTTTEATTSVVAEEIIAEPETSSGVRHLFVNNKVTVLDPHNLTKGEKANIEAVVRKTNHLTNNHVVFVAQDGSVDVLENGEEIGHLSSNEVIEVLTARKSEAESTTETPVVTEATETTEASAENGTIGTAGVISEVKPASTETSPAATEPVTPEVPEPAEKPTPTVDIEALRAEKVALLNTYSLLTPTVKGEFLTRFQQAVDAAALNAIAEEARKIQEREGATKRYDFAITGRAYYPKPLGLMAQESLQQEPIPQAILAAAEENAEKAPTEGRMVTPTKTTVTSMHQGLSATPTVQNVGGTKIEFDFGKQKLYKGDYFYAETQDAPVPFPSTFRLKSDDSKTNGRVIATVERVGYESDFVRGSDSKDGSRFDIKNDQSQTTMKIKYKITFTEIVEGLEDVKATVSGDTSKQTLTGIADRPTQFKVNVNGETVYTGSYVVPKWDDANANNFKRSPYNTGYRGKVTEGLKYTESEGIDEHGKRTTDISLSFGEGNRSKTEYEDEKISSKKELHPFVYLEATVYDYRTNNPESNVKFLTDTKSDGLVQLTGQVGGMPKGFITTIESPTDEAKNRYKWDKEKLRIGDKLPVYYYPFEDVETLEKHPNSKDKKLFVTPNDMYYKIKEISPDGRKITLQFYGDYTKPGRFVTSFENPMKEPEGKSSRLGLNFDSGEGKNGSGTDNSKITVSHPDGQEINDFEFDATSKKYPSSPKRTIRQKGIEALTSKYARLNYDSTATGVPTTTSTPNQIDKGTVIVQYVDENGNKIKDEVKNVTDVEVKTAYNTEKNRLPEITHNKKKYTLVGEGTYAVGTVSNQGHLMETRFKDVHASSDLDGAEPSGIVRQGTRYVTYVYKEVPAPPAEVKKGSVKVSYVDVDGNELKNSVYEAKEQPEGTDYDTTDDHRLPKLVDKNNNIYELISEEGMHKIGTVGKDGRLIKPSDEQTHQASDEEKGKVEGGKTKKVTYVYKKVEKGKVVVHYVDANGNKIKDEYIDTPESATGASYNAAEDNDSVDERPDTINHKGQIYHFSKVSESNKVGDKEVFKADEMNKIGKPTGTVTAGTTHVVYVYNQEVPVPTPPAPTPPEEKKGSVLVHYVNEKGEKILSDYVDTKEAKVGTDYNAGEDSLEKPELISHGGKTYKLKEVSTGNAVGGKVLVPNTTTDFVGPEKSTVLPGTTHVIYVYQEVPTPPAPTPTPPEAPKTGSVIVKYENTAGETIATDVNDTVNGEVGKSYDTTDYRHPKLYKDGKTYVYKEVKKGSVDEKGLVEEGTKVVTYVYEEEVPKTPDKPEAPKTGSVLVNYIDENGHSIKAPVFDEKNQPEGTPYDTADDNRPTSVLGNNGKIYDIIQKAGDQPVGTIDGFGRLIKAVEGQPWAPSEAETGTVTGGVVKQVTYVYKLREDVPTPPKEEKKGSVTVKYEDTEGNEIKDPVKDTDNAPVGTVYETHDNKPPTIKKGDSTYYLTKKEVKEDSAPEKGKVEEGEKVVTYVYEKSGNVVVNYKDTAGNVIKDPVDDEKDAKPGSPYDTTDNRPEEIKTPDGKTYKRVPKLTEGDEKGEVPSGKTTKVTYVYEEVKGKVIVHYIDLDGKTIKDDVVDTPETSTGVDYNTADDNKPATIEKDGKTYELVPVLTKGHEQGKVVAGTTEVTYVYRVKETPQPEAPKEKVGSVVVKYENTKGESIATPINDTVNAKVGTDYDTTDYKPEKIYKDGKTYIYKEVKQGSVDEKGKVVEGTQTVTYVYEEEVLPPTPGIPEKPGSYIPYVPNNPQNPDPNDPDKSIEIPKVPYDETPEDPSNNPPLPPVDGYIPVDPKDPTTPLKPKDPEDPTKGYIPPTIKNPEDPSEDTPVPYVPAGTVTVHYVDEKGNPIKDPTVDTPKSPVGTDYNTNENGTEIPKEVKGKDGKDYVLVKVKDGDKEIGKVVKGNTDVTYIYKVKETPEKPDPKKPGSYIPYVPNNPQNPDPNDPDKSIEIPKVPYDETPEDPSNNPPLPPVDGYVPVDPKDPTTPLKPKDPEDPTKGYIPPTIKNPEDPSEDTPVPYVPAGTVTVHYVDEKGNPIKDPTVDTPTSPVDTDYNTNENGTEIPKEVKGKDGKDYVLVKVKDGDKEIGKVVKGNTDVTYIYKVKETPEKPDPNDPQGPKDPEGPNDPQEPNVPEKPGNPEDPSMPEAPKEKPTPEKPAEPGQPTPEQPGQNKGEVKKSAVLPNTGEASTMIGWSAAALSILAGLGLVATGRKKEDEEA